MKPRPDGMNLGDPDDQDEDDDAQAAAPWHRDIWGDLDERFLGDGTGHSGQDGPNDDDDGEETEDEA